MIIKWNYSVAFIIALLFGNAFASPNSAPDSTLKGPYEVSSAEYRFPAAIDPDVLPSKVTEIWGKMFYPKKLGNKIPLIVMLHGNHATCGVGSNPRKDNNCSYSSTGQCPAGYTLVPNHEGYSYLANNLASWGYLVISINANRTITCGSGDAGDYGYYIARGKLILKHLSLLYKWSSTGGAPASLGLGDRGLVGKIDFAKVGLFGHSRGGLGIRVAYSLYSKSGSPWRTKIPGLTVKALFEVGAVDTKLTSPELSGLADAKGTVWNQLLPLCDGDVSTLEGRYPFDRMLLNPKEGIDAQKSVYEVWGANHNFFNTEWQSSDAQDCFAGKAIFDSNGSHSILQQQIALASVPAFFRSHLGETGGESFNQNFNPLYRLPAVVRNITQVDRDFIPSSALTESQIVEDFDRSTGQNTSGATNVANQITIQHLNLNRRDKNLDPQRAALITWDRADNQTFLITIWSASREGKNIQGFSSLDFRIARAEKANPSSTTDFMIQLEDAENHFSHPLYLSEFLDLNGPGSDQPILQTVRIPLSAFQGVQFSKIRGVKFTFNKTNKGSIYLANIRLQRQKGLGSFALAAFAKMQSSSLREISKRSSPIIVPTHLNKLVDIQKGKPNFFARVKSSPAFVEMRFASQVAFPVMDSFPVLKIGEKEFSISRYADPEWLTEIIFTVPEDTYRSLAKESEVTIRHGKIWQFGTLGELEHRVLRQK